jgi:predicted ATPase
VGLEPEIFGRSAELAELQAHLRGGARLLTIVGPGGMGKTRLARALVAGDPAWADANWVELERAQGLGGVLAAVARSFGLRPGTIRYRTVQRVKEALRGRSLLVLDNAELVLDELAEVALLLKEVAPVLVTSREALRVPGEQLLELGPLSPADRSAMLVARTTWARAGSPPKDEERPLLEQIAADLDGIPLALELAGSRLGVMSAATFTARLHQRFQLLVSTQRGLDPRHRRLRAALDASFELLAPPSQRALAWLAIGAGDFTLPAAEGLLSGALSTAEVISAIEELHQKSWLRRDLGPEGPHFGLYQTIRRYGIERLEERGERTPAQLQHALHYLGAAEGQGAIDRDNLLVILEAEVLPLPLRARAVLALEERSPTTEPARLSLERLQALLPFEAELPEPLGARWSLALARALERSGEVKAAAEAWRRARRRTRQAAAKELRLEVLSAAITTHYMHGRPQRGVALGRRVLRWARPSASARVQARLLTEWGVALHMAGERELADVRYREALVLAETAGEVNELGRTLACVGFLCLDRGLLEEAEAAYRRALAIAEQLGHRDVRGVVLGYLGNLERRRRRLAPARTYYREALIDLAAVDDRQWTAVVQMDLGLLLLDHQQFVEAEGALLLAAQILEDLDAADLEAIVASARAVAAAGTGAFATASPLQDRAELRMPEGAPRRQVLALHRALIDWWQAPTEAHRVAARETLAQSPGGQDDYLDLAAALLLRTLAKAGTSEQADLYERSGAYFQLLGEDRVHLKGAGPARRLLEALITAHLESPGRGLTIFELAQATWPDERILPAAAKNRVRVAIAQLRSLGLREVLQTQGEGYRLSPERPTIIV